MNIKINELWEKKGRKNVMTTTTGAPLKGKPKAKQKKKVVEEKKVGLFDDLRAKIAKKVKGVHCQVMSESDIANVKT